jgi:hypothetical protein
MRAPEGRVRVWAAGVRRVGCQDVVGLLLTVEENSATGLARAHKALGATYKSTLTLTTSSTASVLFVGPSTTPRRQSRCPGA